MKGKILEQRFVSFHAFCDLQMAMLSDGENLTWLGFTGQRFMPDLLQAKPDDNLPVFRQTYLWLEAYFSGTEPAVPIPPIKAAGTQFQQEVWQMLSQIPYGCTTTYGHLARAHAAAHGVRPCAQAIGNAVGHNPISIIVPCHRVIGSNGALTGYAGGLEKKQFLLALESISLL